MKTIVGVLCSLFLFISTTQAYTQAQVSAAINQVMSRYDANTQLQKLNEVLPKIGKIQLSNPPKATWDLLKQIEHAVRERISEVLSSMITIDTAPISSEEKELFDSMNEYRQTRGLPDLVVNTKLNQAAQILADDMGKQGYFDHVSPQGVGYIQRLEVVGYEFSYVSENLGVGNVEADIIVMLRSESPVHEKNLFSESAQDVGVGYDPLTHHRVAVYAKPL